MSAHDMVDDWVLKRVRQDKKGKGWQLALTSAQVKLVGLQSTPQQWQDHIDAWFGCDFIDEDTYEVLVERLARVSDVPQVYRVVAGASM
jgi:hypothetical protein